MEDCAEWCIRGWRKGVPRLSSLIAAWLDLNPSKSGEREIEVLTRTLVSFLLSHRTPTLLLREWLEDFRAACIDEALKGEPTLSDEAEALSKLLQTCAADGEWKDLMIEVFAGQVGSPQHLNLITLHSAKGLEFDVVIMMGMEQGRLPSWAAKTGPPALS